MRKRLNRHRFMLAVVTGIPRLSSRPRARRFDRDDSWKRQVWRIITPPGHWTSFAFEGDGTLRTLPGSLGRRITLSYDGSREIRPAEERARQVTTYPYGPGERMLAPGERTSCVHDPAEHPRAIGERTTCSYELRPIAGLSGGRRHITTLVLDSAGCSVERIDFDCPDLTETTICPDMSTLREQWRASLSG